MTPQQWIQIFEDMRWTIALATNPFGALLWLTWRILEDSVIQVINLLVV